MLLQPRTIISQCEIVHVYDLMMCYKCLNYILVGKNKQKSRLPGRYKKTNKISTIKRYLTPTTLKFIPIMNSAIINNYIRQYTVVEYTLYKTYYC